MNEKRPVMIILVFCICALPLRATSPLEAPSPIATQSDILARARRSVETFWNQFGSVTCIERVTQEKLGKKGGTEYTRKSAFDYVALLNVDGQNLSVDESRVQQGKKAKENKIPLLLTNGIPTLLLVFHPAYQESFQYLFDGEEVVGGTRLARIRFAHLAGTRSTTALRLRDKNHPLEIEGSAWLEFETGAIHRIAARLTAPMSTPNLKGLEIEVVYSPLTFTSSGGIYWLPSTATVEVTTERQHWRNIHRYSDYKRFMVNTEDKIGKAGDQGF